MVIRVSKSNTLIKIGPDRSHGTRTGGRAGPALQARGADCASAARTSAPLSRNEFTPEMRAVLPMTDSLRAELGRMLEEHKAIGPPTKRLADAARAEGNAPVADLPQKLSLHAKGEEELFYPAALLVGEVVRLKSGSTTAAGVPKRP
jgi:hypothetical protein